MTVQGQIVDLLRSLQERHRLAYLFIGHDLRVVGALANEVIVLRAGRVVEQGSAQSVFESPQTDYTRALMAAAFEIKAVAESPLAPPFRKSSTSLSGASRMNNDADSSRATSPRRV